MYMIKMQAACLCIMLMMAVYCRRRRYLNTRTSRVYRKIQKVVIANLIFDIITVYTVNHLEELPAWCNRLAHILFIGSSELILWLLVQYIALLVENEKMNKRVVRLLTDIPFFSGLAVTIAVPFEYVKTPKGNYSYGAPVYVCFGIIVCYLAVICGLAAAFHKSISREKKKTIIPSAAIILCAALLQYFFPTLLASSLGMTLIVFCIFFTRENPENFYNNETGMEDEECCRAMQGEKVEFLQGYYFSRPLTAEKLEEEFLYEKIG